MNQLQAGKTYQIVCIADGTLQEQGQCINLSIFAFQRDTRARKGHQIVHLSVHLFVSTFVPSFPFFRYSFLPFLHSFFVLGSSCYVKFDYYIVDSSNTDLNPYRQLLRSVFGESTLFCLHFTRDKSIYKSIQIFNSNAFKQRYNTCSDWCADLSRVFYST